MSQVSVTLVKSTIGAIPAHRATVEGLGLRKIRQTVVHENTPQIAGMINSVCHLVEVKEISQ